MLKTLLLVFTLSAAITQAAVLTFSSSIPLQKTNWSGTITLPLFDTSFGTLQSVQMTLSGQAVSGIFIESKDTQPAVVLASSGAQLAANSLLGALTVQADNPVTFSATAFDGVTDFSGGSGRTFLGLTASGSDSRTSSAPADLLLFMGPGQFFTTAIAIGKSSTIGSGNLETVFETVANAKLDVRYTFAAASEVPEPMTAGLIGFGLIALGITAKRKKVQ